MDGNEKAEQIILQATLEELPVRVMIDSGAQGNFVSHNLGQRLGTLQRKKENPYRLTMADGTPTEQDDGWIRKELHQAELKINGHRERLSMDITQIKHDIILGMGWLRKHNPSINWKTGILEFPNCSHGTKMGGRSPSKVPFAKAIWVRLKGRMLAQTDIEELPSEYKEYSELFTEKEGKAALPEHQPWDHRIPIKEGTVLKHKGWLKSLSPKEGSFLKEYIEKLERKGFIRRSKPRAGTHESISHGVLFAPKKDGTLRPCIDYRPLNDKTIKDHYPIPRQDELQDRLQGAVWFTALDARDAYHLLRIAEGEEWKTAFRTRWGVYEFLVMPFGLTNAPSSFQEYINDALKEYLDDFVIAYLDDILIFSRTYEEHVQHVRKVMDKLKKHKIPLKLSKCEFHKNKIGFLGYIVSSEGLAPDPKKVQAIEEWPEPKTVKETQSFLGLINYYRKFILNFSKLAKPLTELTKKDTIFNFGRECKEAFKELKARMKSAPILRIFDPEKEAIVETDASDKAIGGCLKQKDDDGKLHPVAYYSKKLTGPEANYDVHDKELLAVVECLKQWRVYLEGAKYPAQIYSDHKNLIYWTTTQSLNRRQVRWAMELASYDFKITHVRGKENITADALSRRADYMEGLEPEPATLLRKEGKYLTYNKPETRMLAIMEQEPSTEEKQKIIRSRHDDKTAGHPGIDKTLELITRDYTWPGLRKDVESYVKNCDTCHKAKHTRHKPYGLLQSQENTDRAWSKIAMDFIVKLPPSKEPMTGVVYDSILTINDTLTKYIYLIPYKESSTAEDLAYTITRTVFSQHGIPEVIITDRDKLFNSQFWQSLTDLLGIKHKMSTSYHPQTDGQTERTNQTIEQYLRCYVNYKQDNWVQLLPIAQFAFNNNKSVTGISPFYANYGRHPELSRESIGLKPIAQKAQVETDKIQELHFLLKTKLDKIAKTTTETANKKRSEGPDFQEGEMVYINTKNIKTQRPNKKLDHTRMGPYKIKKMLGPVSYEIQLPEGMNIHSVFHKSLLEKAPPGARPGPVLIDTETQEPLYDVERILRHKREKGGTRYLVKWLGYPESENTWEPTKNLPPEMLRQYHQHQTPPRNTKTDRQCEKVLAVGSNPHRYLVKWSDSITNEWEPAASIPQWAKDDFHQTINRIKQKQ
jgi:hypothetical protein